jgi:hypothetical protein
MTLDFRRMYAVVTSQDTHENLFPTVAEAEQWLTAQAR